MNFIEGNYIFNQIHQAVSKGNKKQVQDLLNRNSFININGIYGNSTFLLSAVSNNQQDIIEMFLNRGADPNICDVYGQSPLHVAARQGKKNIVDLLLNFKANIDIRDSGNLTPLYYAMSYDHRDVVYTLLKKGAMVFNNIYDSYGRSHLHIAIKNHYHDLIDLILRSGADVNARDIDGSTPLHYAIEHSKSISTLRKLLQTGADVDICNGDGLSAYELSFKCRCHFDFISLIKKYQKSALLYTAVQNNDFELSKKLLEKNQINVNNYDYRVPLFFAISNGNVELVKLLLDYGAVTNVPFHNIIEHAGYCGNIKIIDALLDYEVSADSFNRYDNLYWAAHCKRFNTIKILLQRGADFKMFHYDDFFIKALLNPEIDYHPHYWFKIEKVKTIRRLIVCIVKLIHENVPISEKNMQLIQRFWFFNKLYQDCMDEIEKMKNEKIAENNKFFYYHIFSYEPEKLQKLTRNKEVVENFALDKLQNKFPLFAELLNHNFTEAKKKMDFIMSNKRDLRSIWKKYLSDDLLFKIADYVSR